MVQLNTHIFDTFDNQITTLDLHVAGEPIRLIIDGLSPIPGQTMNEKRLFMQEQHDQVRQLIIQEPRGHREMFAGIFTEPVSDEGRFGMVFMDTRYYPYMCGHGMIGAVTAFIEMDQMAVEAGETHIIADTPAGPVTTCALVKILPDGQKRVTSVSVQMESAFVSDLDQSLDVPDYGRVTVHVVFAGGFFVMVPADQIGLSLTPENAPELARLGMSIMEEGNKQLTVRHPERSYIKTIDVVEFFDTRDHSTNRGKNVVILGEGQVDRSPCGTGTSAKLALLHRMGQLSMGETFVNEGLSGITFEGRIVSEISVGGIPGIVPEIRGSAHITGLHRFVLTPDDPFPYGFLI